MRVSNLSFLNPFKMLAIICFLRRHGIDTIVLNLPIDLKLAGVTARWAGVERIVFRRGLAVPVGDTTLNRYLYRQVATHVIANSKEIVRTILANNSALCQPEKLHVIYNGVDPGSFPRRKKPRHTPPIVLGNAGRMVAQKGQQYLLLIAAELHRRGLDFRLLIGGTGELEAALKQQADTLGIGAQVTFMGFIEEMGAFFEAIDIYLLTSLHEGSANTVIEAMAWGKPIVGFDISSNPEMIIDKETGFLVPFADIRRFTDRVERLCRNAALRSRLGENARRVVEQKFDAKRNIQQLMDLLYPA
jgi:glycosyltransferase involved in cell wall biosynthesis